MNNPWFLSPPAEDSKSPRVYCFPNAGGGASIYARLNRDTLLNLIPVQPPGRENRLQEPAFTNITALVEAASDALIATSDGRAYSLLGHSLGAIVAFEVAHRLIALGHRPPESLWVVSMKPPEEVRVDPKLPKMSDEDFVATVGHRYEGIPESVRDNNELLKLLLPTLRADISVLASYLFRAHGPLSCPIFACTGDADSMVAATDIESWSHYTTGEFQAETFAGGHFFLKENGSELLRSMEQNINA